MGNGTLKGALKVSQIQKRFGDLRAVDRVDLNIEAGEFIAFLGPSGCGKTTLLRIIAGLESCDSGSLTLDGTPIDRLRPNQRDIGMVFQNLALFPHLTVAQNVGFGLSIKGVPAAEIASRVAEMLTLVALDHLADRRVRQLSGGQQQRVALARALILKPAVLLLDEPLSALDMKLRRQLQQELKALQRRTGTTFIFVTHDQEEALSMADRVAVFNAGRLEQCDRPEALYHAPVSRFVADFVGDANIRDAAQMATFGVTVPEGQVLVFRPEDCRIGNAAEACPVQRPARVISVDFVGPQARVLLSVEGCDQTWSALCPGRDLMGVDPGASTTLGLIPDRAAVTPDNARV